MKNLLAMTLIFISGLTVANEVGLANCDIEVNPSGTFRIVDEYQDYVGQPYHFDKREAYNEILELKAKGICEKGHKPKTVEYVFDY